MRFYPAYIISCVLLFLFASCKGKDRSDATDIPIISVTIEPERYAAEQIAGNLFTINCVIPAGQSPETYDPTPQEMMRISQSAAYFRIGNIGFEQAWMDAIREQNPNMPVFDLSEGIKLIANENGYHNESEPDGRRHSHGATDPHIWTSARNMKTIALNIKEAFITIDKANEATYNQNYARLLEVIDSTEQVLDSLLSPLSGDAFVIYHPALTYLAQDYHLQQLCIEMDGKEPSPAQLKALVEAAKEHHATTVFIQQEFDQKNAELIAHETGCRLVPINPLDYDWPSSMIKIAQSLADGR